MNKNSYIYAKFPNELLEYIMCSDLNAAEIKVVLCIARNTYGKRDKECKMSVSDIHKATNISKRHLYVVIKSLMSKSILIETEKATPTTPRCIAINGYFQNEKAVKANDSQKVKPCAN